MVRKDHSEGALIDNIPRYAKKILTSKPEVYGLLDETSPIDGNNMHDERRVWLIIEMILMPPCASLPRQHCTYALNTRCVAGLLDMA